MEKTFFTLFNFINSKAILSDFINWFFNYIIVNLKNFILNTELYYINDYFCSIIKVYKNFTKFNYLIDNVEIFIYIKHYKQYKFYSIIINTSIIQHLIVNFA